MTRDEAIQWLKHCAETDCDDCAYEIQPIEWCSEKMTYCVSVLEEALLKKSNDSKSFSDSADTDLISREDAIEAVQAYLNILINSRRHGDDFTFINVLTEIRNKISALPSADRPQGEWVEQHEDGHGWWVGECDQCGQESRVSNYCPNCGAKMKKIERMEEVI